MIVLFIFFYTCRSLNTKSTNLKYLLTTSYDTSYKHNKFDEESNVYLGPKLGTVKEVIWTIYTMLQSNKENLTAELWL